MSEYKIPCGWSSGSNDFCFKERLCLACCEVEKLNATIERQAQEIASLKESQSVVEPIQTSPKAALPELPSPASKWFGFPVSGAKYFTVSQMIDAMREAQLFIASQPAIQAYATKPLCYVRQSDIDNPIGSAIWAYRMAGGEWTIPVHVSIKD